MTAPVKIICHRVSLLPCTGGTHQAFSCLFTPYNFYSLYKARTEYKAQHFWCGSAAESQCSGSSVWLLCELCAKGQVSPGCSCSSVMVWMLVLKGSGFTMCGTGQQGWGVWGKYLSCGVGNESALVSPGTSEGFQNWLLCCAWLREKSSCWAYSRLLFPTCPQVTQTCLSSRRGSPPSC